VSRRASIGLADQAVSALGNVTLSLAVATSVTTIEFGRFSLVLLLYFTACGVSRALNSEPVVVGNSQNHSSDNRLVHGFAFAGALSAGALASVGLLAAAAVVRAPDLVVLAALLPLLLLQDAVRVALLVDARPGAALANDLVWTGAQIAGVVILLETQSGTALRFLAVWGCTGALAALLGLCQISVAPRFRGLGHRFVEIRPLGMRFATEYVTGAGALQLVFFGIAGVAGLATVAAIRGAQVILGPLNQLLTGLTLAGMPEVTRVAAHRRSRLPAVTGLMSSGAALVGAICVAVALQIPDELGRRLLGDTWAQAKAVLLPVGITICGNMATLGALLGLRALRNARVSLFARAVSALLLVACVAPGLATGASATGLAWLMTAAVWCSVIVWWTAFLRALDRESQLVLEGV
jgi:hypothetical protein